MLKQNEIVFFKQGEIRIGAIITLSLIFIVIFTYLVNSFVNNENQYLPKIHNTILNILSPIRNIGFSVNSMNKQNGNYSIELNLNNIPKVSEIDIIFSKEFKKSISIYTKVNDQWSKLGVQISDKPLESVILVNESDRMPTRTLKIVFSDLSSDIINSDIQKIRLYKPLR